MQKYSVVSEKSQVLIVVLLSKSVSFPGGFVLLVYARLRRLILYEICVTFCLICCFCSSYLVLGHGNTICSTLQH